MKKTDTLKPIIGTWTDLIGEEFYKDYMKNIQTKISFRKKSVFEEYHQESSLFKTFLETPLNKLKVIFIVETPEFKLKHLYSIEKEFFGGLDLNLTSHTNYDWLLNQGIMFFPRRLTWGSETHYEWEVFTDNVLLLVTELPVLVITNNVSVTNLLKQLRPLTKVINPSDPWKHIDEYVKDKKEYIEWSPFPSR